MAEEIRRNGIDKEELMTRLMECINNRDEKIMPAVEEAAMRMAKAFSSHPVLSFSVDFGSALKTVLLYVVLYDGRGFLLRAETGSDEGIVGISVLRMASAFSRIATGWRHRARILRVCLRRTLDV